MNDARTEAYEAVMTTVYEPLQRYLRRRCPPDDVDDVLNDTLLVIWRRLDDVPADMALPWCYGIARRCLANHRRGRDRRSRLHLRIVGEPARAVGAGWTGDHDVALHQALDRLTDGDREIVRLWAWERLEPREIAAVVDSTAGAISSRLGRIRRMLESDLARQDRAGAGHRQGGDRPERTP